MNRLRLLFQYCLIEFDCRKPLLFTPLSSLKQTHEPSNSLSRAPHHNDGAILFEVSRSINVKNPQKSYISILQLCRYTDDSFDVSI
jgi:hypothetical protein